MSEPLPLLPLHHVVFPHERITLKIVEARHLDMIAQCMKADAPFGICLIAKDGEADAPALLHLVGTEARIVDWDMREPGVLGLTVRGNRRFRMLGQETDEQGRITANVEWFEEAAAGPVAPEHQDLLPLLQAILADTRKPQIPRPHRLDDAAWVGYRYAEILPIPPLARQRLLELEDPELRLAIIHAYLVEHKLLQE